MEKNKIIIVVEAQKVLPSIMNLVEARKGVPFTTDWKLSLVEAGWNVRLSFPFIVRHDV